MEKKQAKYICFYVKHYMAALIPFILLWCDLDESGIFLSTFSFRTYLKGNISVPPKMEAKSNLDSSEESGPDHIAVLTPKNFEPELLFIIANHLNMCLKESCFSGF